MEFRYRAGEDRDPYFLSSSSDVDFAAQALRAGFVRGGGGGIGGDMGMGGFLPPILPRETLMRELQMERIRKEILVREITQKRILEEQVRRELELERAMAMRRFEAERFLPFVMESRVGERVAPGFVSLNSDVRADEWLPLPLPPNAMVRKKVRLAHKEIKLPNPKFSGTKRKAASELVRPAKELSCALCQVSARSQVVLNEHLQGKKHKAKEALVSANESKKTGGIYYAKGLMKNIAQGKWSCDLCQVRIHNQDLLNEHLQGKKHRAKEALLVANNKAAIKKTGCTSPADELLKNISEGKKQQQGGIWCELCKVKCNNAAMMACHLKGKKHKAHLENSEKDEDGTAAAGAPAAEVKEVTDQTAKREVKKAAEDATEFSNCYAIASVEISDLNALDAPPL